MTNEQAQVIVDAENKRLNDIAVAKATARLRDISTINKRIETLQGERAELQAEVVAIEFDTVSLTDVLGESAG